MAVVRASSPEPAILAAHEGPRALGADALDAAIVRLVLERLGAGDIVDRSDPRTRAALLQVRESCARARETLSGHDHAIVPVVLHGVQGNIEVTRRDLEDLLGAAFEAGTRQLAHAVRRTTESAGTARAIVSGPGAAAFVPALIERCTGLSVIDDRASASAIVRGAALSIP